MAQRHGPLTSLRCGQVRHEFLGRRVDRVVVVGKRRPTEVYELVAARRDCSLRQVADCKRFEQVRARHPPRRPGPPR